VKPDSPELIAAIEKELAKWTLRLSAVAM
jgi:hypothetical protein